MGIEEPQLHFKTVGNGLEKYGGDVLRKVDLDIDEGPCIQPRKNSMISYNYLGRLWGKFKFKIKDHRISLISEYIGIFFFIVQSFF